MIPLQMKTAESATNDELKYNVLTNLKEIDEWTEMRYPVDSSKQATILSFGKSFRDNPAAMVDTIENELDGKTNDIFTIKHALPLFEDLDIKPKYCVVLDPRSVTGTSTLGHIRKDLFKIYPETTYLVASMTHPSVTRHLLDSGARVVGWHSACEAMKDKEVAAMIPNWVVGGSCSAMRAISLARIFGYRTIALGGCDAVVPEPERSSIEAKARIRKILDEIGIKCEGEDFEKLVMNFVPALDMFTSKKNLQMAGQLNPDQKLFIIEELWDDQRTKREFMKIAINNDIMWCTPELVAIAQDLESIFKTNTDVWFKNYSGGVCGAMWNALGGVEAINPSPVKLP
jgi:hypothetical protein